MKSKKFLLIFTFLLFSVLISACAGGAYTSTSWHGLTAPKILHIYLRVLRYMQLM